MTQVTNEQRYRNYLLEVVKVMYNYQDGIMICMCDVRGVNLAWSQRFRKEISISALQRFKKLADQESFDRWHKMNQFSSELYRILSEMINIAEGRVLDYELENLRYDLLHQEIMADESTVQAEKERRHAA